MVLYILTFYGTFKMHFYLLIVVLGQIHAAPPVNHFPTNLQRQFSPTVFKDRRPLVLEEPRGDSHDTDNGVVNIIGGREADDGEYPWMASVFYNGWFQCGAAILNAKTILTAAHCVQNDPEQRNGQFSLKVGIDYFNQTDAQVLYARKIEMHNQFDRTELRNDIAMIHLSSRITYSNIVQPVPALANGKFDKQLKNNENCYISGFGAISDHPWYNDSIHLMELNISISSEKTCERFMRKTYGVRKAIRRGMFCSMDTHGSDCFGDSGGPVGCYDKKNDDKFTLVGLVSWGPSKRCMKPPSVFTRISTYLKWIKARM